MNMSQPSAASTRSGARHTTTTTGTLRLAKAGARANCRKSAVNTVGALRDYRFRSRGRKPHSRVAPRIPVATAEGPLAGDDQSPFVGNEEAREALISMARMHNLLPSCLLVVVGALSGGSNALAVLQNPHVWVMAAISGAIAIASVVINDYFDFRSGVDVVNSPDKPLPSGIVAPDYAVMFSLLVYIASLIAACLFDNLAVRGIVAMSVFATILYTPLLKRITLVKNLTCASIIAASPVAGAVVVGADGSALLRVIGSGMFVFCCICYREILMDITDRDGDEKAGVRTVPVVVGPTAALASAVAFVLVGAAISAATLASSGMLSGLAALPRYIFASLGGLGLVTPTLLSSLDVYKTGCDHDALDRAIGASFTPIGLGLVALSLVR